jgi:trehalose 6-phosphate phosphatase
VTQPLSSQEGRDAFDRIAAADHPVLFFDVDGTLAPLATRPEYARTPRKTRDLLQALRRTGASVVLVSGRTARDAHRVMGGEFDGILGNHGAEILQRNRLGRWTGKRMPSLRTATSSLARELERSWPGVRLESKGYSLALHHRLSPEELGRLLRVVRGAMMGNELEALRGRRVIDLRARGADKGAAVLRWLERTEKGKVPLSEVLYAGDDTTDEDAIRALGPKAITIAVGQRPRGARFRTPGPVALAKWMHRLERVRRERV